MSNRQKRWDYIHVNKMFVLSEFLEVLYGEVQKCTFFKM